MIEFLIISLLLALGVCGIAFGSRTRQPAVLVPSAEVTRRVLRNDPMRRNSLRTNRRYR